MIQAIDKRITALFQALVNWSQRKPQWWAEQCSYLLLVGAGFGASRDDWQGPPWLRVLLLIGIAVLAGLMWLESRVGSMWQWQRDTSGIFWRLTFAVFLGRDLVVAIMDRPEPDVLCMSIAFTGYLYFLTCEDPPPPKPRTRASLAGSH